ncbi:uncharacterized protein LOC111388226 isoform X1 [Olea europaea var. sylvestris]|uniref:uncharacterized protein LOC111388226 isoform X1 n=1 Tax=Olea europaea var. sylvestris TaxID=158386 RepID=UPI000C1D6F44|nr:uncharacterized protein LOC111388226 isoform X1 [Olea europaea var. sylvestris]
MSVIGNSWDQMLKGFSSRQDRMEQLMKEMNRKNELIISMLTKMVEAKSIFKDQSNHYKCSVVDRDEMAVSDIGDLELGKKSSEGQVHELNGDMGVVATQSVEAVYFPHFGGEGLREWLREAMKYFQLNQTLDELRLGIGEKYLKGKAYLWFYGFIANHPRADWAIFSKELCKRFAENTREEVFVEGNTGIEVADTLKGEVAVVVESLVKNVGNPIFVTGDDWRTF